MGRQPRLTLAVIVKNEAGLLQRLLHHHRGLVDEVVVVDTGSRDGSAEIARAAGAKVSRFAWCDDFSAARNHGLDLATGQAILSLDCDELIAQHDFSQVREQAAAVAAGCVWILTQRNYTKECGHPDWEPAAEDHRTLTLGAPGYVPAFSIRLYPNLAGLRYQGRIHETLEPSVRDLGLAQRPSAVPVHHHGHLSPSKQAARKILYGKLLRQKIRTLPKDSGTRFELAVQLVEEGQEELARRLLARTVAEDPGGAEVHRARILLGRLLLRRRQQDAALAQFTRALRERPDWRPAWAETVQAQWESGRAALARQYLAGGLKLFPADPRLLRLAAQVFPETADNESGRVASCRRMPNLEPIPRSLTGSCDQAPQGDGAACPVWEGNPAQYETAAPRVLS